jgi:hypothetical protein
MKRTQEEIARIEMVWTAFVRAVIAAGPLPDRIEDMAAHTAKHYTCEFRAAVIAPLLARCLHRRPET